MDTREWEKRARELAECQDVMPKSLEELQTRVYGAAMDMADTADEKICELLEARTREVISQFLARKYQLGCGYNDCSSTTDAHLEEAATEILKYFGIK